MNSQWQDVMDNNHDDWVDYFYTVTCESCLRHRRVWKKDSVYSTGWRLVSFKAFMYLLFGRGGNFLRCR